MELLIIVFIVCILAIPTLAIFAGAMALIVNAVESIRKTLK